MFQVPIPLLLRVVLAYGSLGSPSSMFISLLTTTAACWDPGPQLGGAEPCDQEPGFCDEKTQTRRAEPGVVTSKCAPKKRPAGWAGRVSVTLKWVSASRRANVLPRAARPGCYARRAGWVWLVAEKGAFCFRGQLLRVVETVGWFCAQHCAHDSAWLGKEGNVLIRHWCGPHSCFYGPQSCLSGRQGMDD